MRSRRNKEQSGLSYHLHYRETCARVSSEHMQSTNFGLLVEAGLFRLTDWFHIHLFFYLSKAIARFEVKITYKHVLVKLL